MRLVSKDAAHPWLPRYPVLPPTGFLQRQEIYFFLKRDRFSPLNGKSAGVRTVLHQSDFLLPGMFM
jgi:hypothetical protein